MAHKHVRVSQWIDFILVQFTLAIENNSSLVKIHIIAVSYRFFFSVWLLFDYTSFLVN